MFRQQRSNIKALPILELSLQFFEIFDRQSAPLDLLSHDGESKNGVEGVEKSLIDMGAVLIRLLIFHGKKNRSRTLKNFGLKNISDFGLEEVFFNSEIRNPQSAILLA